MNTLSKLRQATTTTKGRERLEIVEETIRRLA
jgi:hypothetical protein